MCIRDRYQGGNELQYVIPGLSKEMVVVIQALVILFTGAMEGLFRPGLQRIFMTLSPQQKAAAIEANQVKSGS